jgi:serine protease Do
MKSSKAIWLVAAMVLILGFWGGAWLGPRVGLARSSAPTAKEAAPPGEPAQNTPSRQMVDEFSQSFEQAASKVSPSVVAITAEQQVAVQSPFGMPDDPLKDFFGDDFFKQFFGQPAQPEKRVVRSLGSGVIVSTNGIILTNNHVVANADKLNVVIGDKKTYPAKVIGTDPQTDIAVVKIEASGLPAASLGNSDRVKVGQWVLAIGNPFQLMRTVTAGIISAEGRSNVGLADYEDFIQTDASINPGNSGGALADLNGSVIGINTAITSPSGGNIGIGFAIPINMAKQVMDTLISKGKVVRGYLGLLPQDIDDNLAKALQLKSTEGALVAEVTAGGPADKAGLKRGDVIVSFNGQKVEDATSLKIMAAAAAPHSKAKLGLLREGKEMELWVELGERPGPRSTQPSPQEQPEEKAGQKLGLSLQTLTPDIAGQLGYDRDQGVVITDVAPGSAADDAGLQQGDLIKEVNRRPVRNVQDFENAIKSARAGEVVAFLIRRGSGAFYIGIKMPA